MKNQVFLEGRIKEPELRFTAGGHALCQTAMVVEKRKQNEKGEWFTAHEDWFEMKAWNQVAEVLALIPRGETIAIEGRLEQESWENKEGNGKRSKIVVVVESFSIPVKSAKTFAVEGHTMQFHRAKSGTKAVDNGIEEAAYTRFDSGDQERPF